MVKGMDQIIVIDQAETMWGEPLDVHRQNLRAPFQSEHGKALLAKLIKRSGMFDAITADTVSDHNFVVSLLEEMGFLDESNLMKFVEFFLSLPLHASREELAREYRDGTER